MTLTPTRVISVSRRTWIQAQTLHDGDLYAVNDLANPERVGLSENTTARIEGNELTVVLPPVSWTALAFS